MKKSPKGKNSGPKTPAGKVRSSGNARIHGLFANEFAFSETERPEFDRLRCDLLAELRPRTASEWFVFEDLAANAWRLKLALRYEQLAMQKFARANTAETTAPAKSPHPYVGSTLRSRLKIIDELNDRISGGKSIADLEKVVIEAFDEEFWKLITEWGSESPALYAMAQALLQKSAIFHTEPPLISGDSVAVLPANLYQELMRKLLDQEKRNLLRGLEEGRTPEDEVQRAELFLRYHTKGRRDFYHALREYRI
jgi:hypothetical protein